jgi:RNA polymerase sigma-70 factor (ECF subfamily)
MTQNTAQRMDFEAQALPQLESLYRTALYVLDNESQAQDLVQETFLRAYRSWHESQFSPNCRLWLFKIMAIALMNKHGSTYSRSVAMDSADEIDGHFAHSVPMHHRPVDHFNHVPASVMSADDVSTAVRGLPDDCRLAVVLSLQEGFSYREIADIAGVTSDTVRSTLLRGRTLMRKELHGHVTHEVLSQIPEGGARRRSMG